MSAKTKRNKPVNRIETEPRPEPTHEQIALCALSIWEAEGRPQGRELEHWLLAEVRLRQGVKPEAGTGMRGEQARRAKQSDASRPQPQPVTL